VSARLIVIAATNHAEELDPALVRPGRLNRVITVDRPSIHGIQDIIRHHLGPDDLPGADLMGVATLGNGATGAEVAAWVKAARREARVAGRQMEPADLIGQVAPPDGRSPAELLACARHEIGHACAVEALSVGEVLTVTTVQVGETAGLTRTRMANRVTMSRSQLDAYVVATLSGRAADEAFGEATTGSGGPAGSDLGLATATLSAMHASLGLGGSLLHLAPDAQAVDLLRWNVDLRRSVEADLNRLYGVAQNFVETHRSCIDALAHRLVEARILTGGEIRTHLKETLPSRGSPKVRGGRRG
jgi:ATP-dependent Zn protease